MSSIRVHFFQHVLFEDTGYIESWVQSKACFTSTTRFYESQVLPDLSEIDWLVVLGGPMSVHDEKVYPWLIEEKKLIQHAINENKVVLGICLGAQLIASVLGAEIFPGEQKEIGWYPVTKTRAAETSPLMSGFPQSFHALHWHGDTFNLPPAATHLASSALYPNQAFSYGENVVGLQFHLESTPHTIRGLINHCGHELKEGPWIQSEKQIKNQQQFVTDCNKYLEKLLNYLYRKNVRYE